MNGGKVEGAGEAGCARGEEEITRDVEFGDDRKRRRAEDVHDKGLNLVVFVDDGKERIMDIRVAEAEDVTD